MFWGLIMEPGKKYSQVVEKDFHIAQAALDLDSAQNSPVQVLISIDGRNYLVCTLIKDKICQANLDLNFNAGAKVSFATNGPGHVHLTGYLIEDNELVMEEDSDDDVEEEEVVDERISTKKRKAQQNKMDQPNKKTKTAMMLDQLDEESYNEDEDSNVNLTDLMDDSDDSDDESADDEDVDEEEGEAEEGSDDDDDEDDESDEEDSSEEDVKEKVSPKKPQESPKQNGVAKKTPKSEKVQKVDKTPKGGDKSPKNEKTPKGPKTPVQENQKTPKGNKSPGGGDSGTPVKKIMAGGVVIEDLKVGDGPVAKSGRNVRVYYEGRLKTTNKVFDSSNKGAGFKFRLGKQEVIKGWDVGVVGMKIGGKRRITCPPHMAYGPAGSPPVIPPNSTLVFDVELKQVS